MYERIKLTLKLWYTEFQLERIDDNLDFLYELEESDREAMSKVNKKALDAANGLVTLTAEDRVQIPHVRMIVNERATQLKTRIKNAEIKQHAKRQRCTQLRAQLVAQ